MEQGCEDHKDRTGTALRIDDHYKKGSHSGDRRRYKRSEFIEKGGWDKMPGQKEADYGVARACADGIELGTKE
jgi:hypothetical protein